MTVEEKQQRREAELARQLRRAEAALAQFHCASEAVLAAWTSGDRAELAESVQRLGSVMRGSL